MYFWTLSRQASGNQNSDETWCTLLILLRLNPTVLAQAKFSLRVLFRLDCDLLTLTSWIHSSFISTFLSLNKVSGLPNTQIQKIVLGTFKVKCLVPLGNSTGKNVSASYGVVKLMWTDGNRRHYIILFSILQADMYRKTTKSTYSTNYLTKCRTERVFSCKIFF